MKALLILIGVSFVGVTFVGADVKEVKGNETIPKPDVYSLHIKSDITYRYAKTLITSNVKNPANISQEVIFYVVLPETAFITGFVMRIKGKDYEAYIKEKEQAKEDYSQAIAAGLSAAHISFSARDSNEFQVAVNIEPEEKVTFNLTYEQLLERVLSKYKHEININPGQIVEDMKVQVNIKESLPIINLEVPDLKVSNEISEIQKENTLAKVEKPDPKRAIINWSPTKEEQKHLAKDGVKGQFLVYYDVDRSENPQQILIDDGYFVHFYANDNLTPLNKHVVFVLDLSGSMHGKKLQQVKEAMHKILSDLTSNNYFSLVLFSDTAQAWTPNKTFEFPRFSSGYFQGSMQPVQSETELTGEYIVPASDENINAAKKFVSSLEDLGGTNIISGLRMGIKLTKIGNTVLANEKDPSKSLIVFLTDGEPNVEMSDPNEITKTTKEINSLRSAIFSLGFGDGADIKFLRNLSLANSGYARNIYEGADATLQLNNFFKEIASPVFSNVTFQYLPGQVEDGTTNVHFDTLFSGSELVVAGKLTNNSLVGSLIGTALNGVEKISFTSPIIIDHVEVPPVPQNKTYGHLERVWAYKSVSQLIDRNIVEQNNSLKEEALKLAVEYSFVTPLTSLVVVKPNKTTNVDATKPSRNPGNFGFPMALAAGAPSKVAVLSGSPGAPGPSHFSSAGFASFAMPAPALFASSFPSTLSVQSLPVTTVTDSLKADVSSIPPALELESTNFGNVSFMFNLVNYTDVSWLENVTLPLSENFLRPPGELLTSDIIALNETNLYSHECIVNGTKGQCTHFVYCVLDIFVDDISAFIPWKCHIDPNYIGVCCPKNVLQNSM